MSYHTLRLRLLLRRSPLLPLTCRSSNLRMPLCNAPYIHEGKAWYVGVVNLCICMQAVIVCRECSYRVENLLDFGDCFRLRGYVNAASLYIPSA